MGTWHRLWWHCLFTKIPVVEGLITVLTWATFLVLETPCVRLGSLETKAVSVFVPSGANVRLMWRIVADRS
jgi:hypothetical protein